MAQRVQVVLLDDVDGGEADESLSFGLDGAEYEIDLNSEHASELRAAIQRWVSHARRVGGRSKVQNINTRRPRATTQPDTDTTAIRQWAKENGHTISDRGRISTEIQEAYKNRHKITVPEAVVSTVEGEAKPQEKPKGRGRSARKTAATKEVATA